MAPVDIYTSTSLVPVLTVIAHVVAVVWLTTLVGRTASRSYLTLPPSSDTRHREPLRKRHVRIFSYLALLSLAAGAFYSYKFGSLSYRIWADERGIDLPSSFFGDSVAFRDGEHPGRLHPVRWLNDTTLYQEVLEIVTGKSRYFWWGQQITLSTVSWSNFVAIEGQRRKITYLWAFMGLAQLVNLSYAQNLFFVTLILTPVPLPANIRDLTRESVPITSSKLSQLKSKILLTKPEGWMPKPFINITILLATYVSIFLVPFASNTPSFMTVITISKLLPFTPLMLPYLIPKSWGSVGSARQNYPSYATAFRAISAISILLHMKSSTLALFYNTPSENYYSHTLLHPFNTEHRSALKRGSTAIASIFGAVGEHPAVDAVGWDVLLTGLSLGAWAGIRGLDANNLLSLSFPFMPLPNAIVKAAAIASNTIKVEVQKPKSPLKRRPGRPKKDADNASTVPPTPGRGRGRPKKYPFPEEAAYEPSDSSSVVEGDGDAEEDMEMAAFAWGLITVGGLGAGSAGVYGAEVLAR
ncbi:hypothetical protein BJ878DRAFT_189105 [Calycina marina]|uniref:Uncharacterized protein n=1 Tax=Calycina marina TaxID=1763456 RepID=A0A9P8CCM1_9HELO|nr:hypothetical protein BJ878DRAFT_189105 [Calycina marina]